MADELDKLNPSDVVFLEKLKESKNTAIFKVAVNGTICVMKVYHSRSRSDASSPDLEVDLFICESTAYRRMKAKGLCTRGVVPDFYGTITNIQPTLWPSLHMFIGDKLPPNAIIIEYIANMEPIGLSNFSEHRLAELYHILKDIHQVRILHGDLYPRNMMIAEGEQDRVLWIDFDSAQTFSEGPLSPKQEKWFKEEIEMMDYFVKDLTEDYKEGRINHTRSYYYEWYV
ncbi:hypothetical protein DTO027B5_2056 [Paecilomyces variotii]|nr:hypothetical protein DTO169C6_595 [Paecilomyces variotii]KAJ9290766.1 hypothetical protein DTO021C3_1700 [Paecilomyces variotii]KAJ9325743.1 hypothetical protein DTO027B3_3387 [Paecilomyces variotii]KAJ9336053.1 hypothetical protein DTO027B5_2056 [Paecilomyces variotii]KAJ9395145.1 hypothetical protein DTO282F9_7954 [Paecilomyces variotii]